MASGRLAWSGLPSDPTLLVTDAEVTSEFAELSIRREEMKACVNE